MQRWADHRGYIPSGTLLTAEESPSSAHHSLLAKHPLNIGQIRDSYCSASSHMGLSPSITINCYKCTISSYGTLLAAVLGAVDGAGTLVFLLLPGIFSPQVHAQGTSNRSLMINLRPFKTYLSLCIVNSKQDLRRLLGD